MLSVTRHAECVRHGYADCVITAHIRGHDVQQ